MSFVVGPLIQIASRAGPAAIATGKTANSIPKANILADIGKFFSNIIKPVTPAATQVTKKAVIPTSVTNLVKGVSKNVAIGSGTILTTNSLLSLTKGGQNVVTTTGESVENITNLGSNVTKLLNNNPLIPIGLIILGGLVLVSVIKK